LDNTTIINHQGGIYYETIGELIHKLKKQSQVLNIPTGVYKKLLLVMIEVLENIMKHSEMVDNIAEKSNNLVPNFTIRKAEESYYVSSANTIRNQRTESLSWRLNYLNTLDQTGLKDYYKKTITNGEFTTHGGAGLGLIEIAKISGRRLEYEFTPLNESFTRFSLKIAIDETSSQ
jgi:hypothetical protein